MNSANWETLSDAVSEALRSIEHVTAKAKSQNLKGIKSMIKEQNKLSYMLRNAIKNGLRDAKHTERCLLADRKSTEFRLRREEKVLYKAAAKDENNSFAHRLQEQETNSAERRDVRDVKHKMTRLRSLIQEETNLLRTEDWVNSRDLGCITFPQVTNSNICNLNFMPHRPNRAREAHWRSTIGDCDQEKPCGMDLSLRGPRTDGTDRDTDEEH